jgi:hypothetical protein
MWPFILITVLCAKNDNGPQIPAVFRPFVASQVETE